MTQEQTPTDHEPTLEELQDDLLDAVLAFRRLHRQHSRAVERPNPDPAELQRLDDQIHAAGPRLLTAAQALVQFTPPRPAAG